MWQRFHHPWLQQRHELNPESAEHLWAGFGQADLNIPKWRSCHLQRTTSQRRWNLQLSLAAVQSPQCCLHPSARWAPVILWDPVDVPAARQASGSVAQRPVAWPISSRPPKRWATAWWLRNGHWVKTPGTDHQAAGGFKGSPEGPKSEKSLGVPSGSRRI